jgi:hypothetical protein
MWPWRPARTSWLSACSTPPKPESESAGPAHLSASILFGAAHAYQGLKQAIVIAVLGTLYGVLASWCGTLRPGMIAHAWSDIYGGYLKFL